MSFGGKKAVPADEVSDTGQQEDTLANATENVAVPIVLGRRRVPVRWFSRVYKQRAQVAPLSLPGKK